MKTSFDYLFNADLNVDPDNTARKGYTVEEVASVNDPTFYGSDDKLSLLYQDRTCTYGLYPNLPL